MTREELKRKKIGVLRGGLSPEREIAFKTGQAVLNALLKKNYQAVGIDVDRFITERLLEEKIDTAFIALHGSWGEDGSIQGLLEMTGTPYTGSGVLASALAMNKVMAKKIFCYHQIPTPEFQVLSYRCNVSEITMELPLIVKPVCGGSTIGTTIATSRNELEEALKSAAGYDQEILVERYVKGVDITVGIINGEPLPVIEIVPESGFYDYTSKYTPGKTEYIIPARLSQERAESAQKMGVTAYQALQCAGAARVDFWMDKKGNLAILEVNTIPGLTETSLLPLAAAEAGIDFPTLIERMLLLARLHIGMPFTIH
ncbi:MAG: D-alanine--D-alanine ligase [Proteobacteria bacterium]|nr:D-alanine--D-alanine ligase [Pseudomonadota bacterium]